jgi:single-strand DNA-binding protein
MSARSLNRVMLIGNLTRDPELRYTPTGTAVTTFGLATNRTWTPSDGGDRQEETEYHRIVAWAKLAEICSQLLYKGRKVYVEGRLQTRKWSGQDGVERESTEVVIDSMIALGAPKGKTEYQHEGTSEDYLLESYDAQGGTQATPVAKPQSAAQPVQDDSQADDSDDSKKSTAKTTKKAAPTEEEVDADDIPF